MGRTMTVTGADELSRALEQCGERAAGIAAQSLYDGAGVMADAISEAVHGINTEPFVYKKVRRKPSPEEKAILEQGAAGIAKFEKNGSEVKTAVGFTNSGYGELNGKQVPIPLIANAINSGTSFMDKQPFFRKGVRAASASAVQAMTARGEELLQEILNDT